MHCLENLVGAGLQRQMNVLGQFRQPRDRIDQVVGETDRMRRSETQSLESLNVMNGFKQLHKRRFVVDLRKLVPAVKIHNLPQ